MTFKKLALASAIAALPAASMAVDYLDDEMMSGVTGQDGIRVTLDLNLQTDVAVHDTSGIGGYSGSAAVNASYTPDPDTNATPDGGSLVGGTYVATTVTAAGIAYVTTTAGAAPAQVVASGSAPVTLASGTNEAFDYGNDAAIVIEGMAVASNGLIVDIDAGNSAVSGGAPVLNVGVNIADGTTVTTGSIRVANSNRDEDDDANGVSDWGYGTSSGSDTIVESSTITLGNTLLNVQLANEPQGHMIRLITDIAGATPGAGALRIANAAVRDLNGAPGSAAAGSLGADAIAIGNTGTPADFDNLSVDVGIDVDATRGLVVTINQLGDVNNGASVHVERAYLGSPALGYIGDLEMNGLNLSGTQIAISGK